MNNPKRIAGTLVVLALFGSALFWALRSTEETKAIAQEQAVIAQTEAMKGLIAVDVEPFFKDERVIKLLTANRLPVQAARVGSRDMAGKLSDSPDFFFASGVVDLYVMFRDLSVRRTHVADT